MLRQADFPVTGSHIDECLLNGDYISYFDLKAALDENGENTLKVYSGIDKRTKKVILKYANEAVYPGKRILVGELTVQGVAKHVIKAL